MSTYGEALVKLVAQCESAGVPAPELALLMSVIRGPDSGDEELKARYTAPLRLFLLGRAAYQKAHYFPPYYTVSRDLPKAPPPPIDHYLLHITMALSIIAYYRLVPADGDGE